MTKTAKLHAWIVANPRASIPFYDFERVILAIGFSLKRVAGSHRHYEHPFVPAILTVQPRGKDAKAYQVEQFLAICARYNLTLDD